MSELGRRVAALREKYDDCFGCGLTNPMGLHLDGFKATGTEITANFTPRDEYRGFSGVLHGGILAALLDETMAWTAMLIEGAFVVTANLEVKFRRPAPTDTTYVVHGTVTERRGRRLRIQGRVLADDEVIAEATGLFLATDPVVP